MEAVPLGSIQVNVAPDGAAIDRAFKRGGAVAAEAMGRGQATGGAVGVRAGGGGFPSRRGELAMGLAGIAAFAGLIATVTRTTRAFDGMVSKFAKIDPVFAGLEAFKELRGLQRDIRSAGVLGTESARFSRFIEDRKDDAAGIWAQMLNTTLKNTNRVIESISTGSARPLVGGLAQDAGRMGTLLGIVMGSPLLTRTFARLWSFSTDILGELRSLRKDGANASDDQIINDVNQMFMADLLRMTGAKPITNAPAFDPANDWSRP